jgi:hypothetical protein
VVVPLRVVLASQLGVIYREPRDPREKDLEINEVLIESGERSESPQMAVFAQAFDYVIEFRLCFLCLSQTVRANQRDQAFLAELVL